MPTHTQDDSTMNFRKRRCGCIPVPTPSPKAGASDRQRPLPPANNPPRASAPDEEQSMGWQLHNPSTSKPSSIIRSESRMSLTGKLLAGEHALIESRYTDCTFRRRSVSRASTVMSEKTVCNWPFLLAAGTVLNLLQ